MIDRDPVYILDGHNLLYRAHFAFIRNPLYNSKGIPTSVPYGFVRMLAALLRERRPTYLAIAFDSEGPTERHRLYHDYKAGRAPMPDEIRRSIPVVQEIVAGYRIPILQASGCEADDLIGTAAVRLAQAGHPVRLVSGDKDLLQLVSDRVRVIATRKGLTEFEEFGPTEVEERWGVPPERIAELLALAGDSTDNIPGVPGIGPKGAAKLLRESGPLVEILDHPERIASERIRSLVVEAADRARLGLELATISTCLPLELDLESCRVREPDRSRLRAIFTELEFRELAQEMAGAGPEAAGGGDYALITTEAGLAELAVELGGARALAIAAIWCGPGPDRARLIGLALSPAPGRAAYVPFGHRAGEQLPPEAVRAALGGLLSEETPAKAGHDVKSDLVVLARAGLPVGGLVFDTMVAAHLLDPGRRQLDLEGLAADYLDWRKQPLACLTGKDGSADSVDLLGPPAVARIACQNADAVARLRAAFEPELERQGLAELNDRIERPLIPVLADMESIGVRIDTGLLAGLASELTARLSALEQDIHAEAGGPFNIRSPKQLSQILFEKLRYPTRGIRKTSLGYSTDEDCLSRLVRPGLPFRQLPELIIEHRNLAKLLSTYVEALPRAVNPETGRLHTSLNQAVTETGRLSSSEPNLQNIPVRGEWGTRIRQAFVPGPDGWLLLAADYSQMELRILAHLAGDEAMLAAFRRGEDIHARTAAEVFGVPLEAVLPEQRRMAKVINFGIDYGMTEFGLAARLGIPVPEARSFIRRYLARYPGVSRYIEETIAFAREHGYVQTLMGRRRRIMEIQDRRQNVRQAAERRAVNMPVQGSAADAIKAAMIRIAARLATEGRRARLILQVHDELVFELPPDEVEPVSELARAEMEGALALAVPLVVTIHTGRNWAEAH